MYQNTSRVAVTVTRHTFICTQPEIPTLFKTTRSVTRTSTVVPLPSQAKPPAFHCLPRAFVSLRKHHGQLHHLILHRWAPCRHSYHILLQCLLPVHTCSSMNMLQRVFLTLLLLSCLFLSFATNTPATNLAQPRNPLGMHLLKPPQPTLFASPQLF